METKPYNQHPCHFKQLGKLNLIAGQIEGIKKMINQERYCVDILTQLKAIRLAVKSVELNILKTHLATCVKKAVKAPEEVEEKIGEIISILKNFR